MDHYRISVFLHLLMGIVLTGQALFWVLVHAGLRQQYGKAETVQYMALLQRARWPHVAVPYAWRIPLRWLSWLVLLLLAATGIAVIQTNALPSGPLWSFKLGLLVVLAALQVLLSWRLYPWLAWLNLLVVLAEMIVSSWLFR